MAGMSGRKQLQRATERLVAGGKLSAADLLRAARDLTEMAGAMADQLPEKSLAWFDFSDDLDSVTVNLVEMRERWQKTGKTKDDRRCSCGGWKMQGCGICETCMSS